MSAIEVEHYLGRARDFFEGMKFLQDDLTEYRYSSALLGIHCALSYGDALRIGMGSSKLPSEDHRNAAKELKFMLVSRNFEKSQGADRLEKLLSKKSRISYAPEATRENEAEDIVKQAHRFAKWAEDTGRKLRIEGW
jgi:hypothetical protein